MSAHLALPRQGHLEQVIHIFGYIKSHNKFRLMFDSDDPHICDKMFKSYYWFDSYKNTEELIPSEITEARGLPLYTSVFVDADLAGDKILGLVKKVFLYYVTKLLHSGIVQVNHELKLAPLELNSEL